MIDNLQEMLVEWGITAPYAAFWARTAGVVLLALLAFLANLLARGVLLVWIRRLVERTETKLDDALVQHQVFLRLSHLAPGLVIYFAAPLAFSWSGTAIDFVRRVGLAYMTLAGMLVINALVTAVEAIYNTLDVANARPIGSYVRFAKTCLYVATAVVIISVLMDKAPWAFLGGIGATVALLTLVLRDSIQGVAASVRLASTDIVRLGDWIEVPRHDADGEVVDVSLHTVRVRNWDRSVTAFPVTSLAHEPFRNWRGLVQSAGRRIKRAIHIDMNSIRFCTDEMLDRFEASPLLCDYVQSKRDEIAAGEGRAKTPADWPSGRSLTNMGIFRAYVEAWLRNHPDIHQQATFLVRELSPGPSGLPLEVYVFCTDEEWAGYERVQAAIFDHLLAVLPQFGLCVFQNPTGQDFRLLKEQSNTQIAQRHPDEGENQN